MDSQKILKIDTFIDIFLFIILYMNLISDDAADPSVEWYIKRM